MPRLAANQIREINTNPGDIVSLVDVGGFPGMPAVDGSLLLNINVNGSNNPNQPLFPGEWVLGDRVTYPNPGGTTAGNIQYARLPILPSGKVFDRARAFINSGGASGRDIRLGIYGQAAPLSPTGTPLTKLAETAVLSTNGVSANFITAAFTSPWTVPANGYYWIAFITNSSTVQFAVSAQFRAGFLPVRRQVGSGTTLPATTGTLTNPQSAMIFASILEVGA